MSWDLSCPDWEARLRAGRTLVPDLPLNLEEADRAVKVFDQLRLPDVPGVPLLADAVGDWFRVIVRALFGSFDAVTNERMIREIFALIPKKNSKTTNGAELLLTAVLLNRRPRAEFLFIGPTQAISEMAFSQAVGSVLIDADLRKRFHIQDHLKQITYKPTGAKLKIKTFDTKVLTGVKPVGVLVDEIHEIASSHDADRVIGQLRGGLLPNPEAFLVMITTQSERPPAGVFRTELNKARAIRDGRLKNVPLLPVLYEFPESMIKSGEWRDSKNWGLVTPNKDRSVKIERLVQDSEGAKAGGEEEYRRWASQHLNIEIGIALRSDRWIGADYWEPAVEAGLTLDELFKRSEVIVVGIDGGGLDDLLGLVVLGRCKITRRWLCWAHAWAHKVVLERRKEIAPRLLDFKTDGDLTIVDLPGQDVAEVADIVVRVKKSGLLPDKHAIGVDAIGIGSIVDELTSPERGITLDQISAIPQGWQLAGAIKDTERALAGGDLVHAASAMMDWCIGNAKVEPRGNAISITKQASGTAKIDPLMALFNASALMAKKPTVGQGGPSVYESRDLMVMRVGAQR